MANPAWRSIQCAIGEINLAVLGLGQSFRWRRIQTDGIGVVWQGVMAGRVWQLREDPEEEKLHFRVLGKFSRSGVSEDEMALRDYFQLDAVPSMQKFYADWSRIDPHFSSVAIGTNGIRVLRQDPIECLFAFICSTNNNIKRITAMVETLCRLYGEPLALENEKSSSYAGSATPGVSTDLDDSVNESKRRKISKIDDSSIFYDFPTVTRLAADDVESTLRKNGFGYRAAYVAATAKLLLTKFVNDDGIWRKLMELRTMGDRKAAIEFLSTLRGVGPKVADCVALMSLDKTDSVPVDTHVRQITAEKYLPALKKTKSMTARTYQEIGDFYRNRFGLYAGWAHSVLFSAQVTKKTLGD